MSCGTVTHTLTRESQEVMFRGCDIEPGTELNPKQTLRRDIPHCVQLKVIISSLLTALRRNGKPRKAAAPVILKVSR